MNLVLILTFSIVYVVERTKRKMLGESSEIKHLDDNTALKQFWEKSGKLLLFFISCIVILILSLLLSKFASFLIFTDLGEKTIYNYVSDNKYEHPENVPYLNETVKSILKEQYQNKNLEKTDDLYDVVRDITTKEENFYYIVTTNANYVDKFKQLDFTPYTMVQFFKKLVGVIEGTHHVIIFLMLLFILIIIRISAEFLFETRKLVGINIRLFIFLAIFLYYIVHQADKLTMGFIANIIFSYIKLIPLLGNYIEDVYYIPLLSQITLEVGLTFIIFDAAFDLYLRIKEATKTKNKTVDSKSSEQQSKANNI